MYKNVSHAESFLTIKIKVSYSVEEMGELFISFCNDV